MSERATVLEEVAGWLRGQGCEMTAGDLMSALSPHAESGVGCGGKPVNSPVSSSSESPNPSPVSAPAGAPTRLEQMQEIVARAILGTSHCGGYYVEDGDPCDGLDGCEDCLAEAANSVLAGLNRAGFIRGSTPGEPTPPKP